MLYGAVNRDPKVHCQCLFSPHFKPAKFTSLKTETDYVPVFCHLKMKIEGEQKKSTQAFLSLEAIS